jgi:hypothetical protein
VGVPFLSSSREGRICRRKPCPALGFREALDCGRAAVALYAKMQQA